MENTLNPGQASEVCSSGFSSCDMVIHRSWGDYRIGEWNFTSPDWKENLNWWKRNWKRVLLWKFVLLIDHTAVRMIMFVLWFIPKYLHVSTQKQEKTDG